MDICCNPTDAEVSLTKIHKVPAIEQRKQTKTRVAVYCRVSTTRTEQEDSLEVQQSTYRSYIQNKQEWELVGIYADTRSGLNADKRSSFQQMIRDAEAGKIDMILCKSISRFSRNIVECQRYTERLKSKNVVVVFEKENIRTDVPTSSLIFSLMCAIAQDESRSISENMKTANRHRVEAGIFIPHRNQMLGYDVEKGKLVPNKDAGIIMLVFHMFAEAKAIAEICRKLNEKGITRMRVKAPFVPAVIQNILKNETYVGDKCLQKQAPKNFITKRPDDTLPYATNYLTDDHEAIVSREVWNRVQKRLADEQEQRKMGIIRREGAHIFYGKVFCGECGGLYRRRTMTEKKHDASGQPVHYKAWNCAERQKGRKGNGCKNDTVREDVLVTKVCEVLDCSLDELGARLEGIQRIEIKHGDVAVEE